MLIDCGIGPRITGDRTGQSNSRGVGWEFVHVCIDDASRVAFSQIYPDEKAVSAVAFLKAAVAYYASLGVTVIRNASSNYMVQDLCFFLEQLGVLKDNLSAANSRIKDVDVAEESTQFARYNILVQAGTAMLAQANATPQTALRLLT